VPSFSTVVELNNFEILVNIMEAEEDESLTFLLDVYMPKAKDFMNVLRAMSFREASLKISFKF
jgi:hypothetical protein